MDASIIIFGRWRRFIWEGLAPGQSLKVERYAEAWFGVGDPAVGKHDAVTGAHIASRIEIDPNTARALSALPERLRKTADQSARLRTGAFGAGPPVRSCSREPELNFSA